MRSNLASLLCLAAGLVVGAASSFAQNDDRFVRDVDAKQRAACTPDVQRLCNDYIPDVPQIVACLKRQQASLSPICAEVFAAPEACKADVQTLCKDYLVVVPGVVACLRREGGQGNLSAECANAFAALEAPAANTKTTATKKKPADKKTAAKKKPDSTAATSAK
jgi:hypothetical protein